MGSAAYQKVAKTQGVCRSEKVVFASKVRRSWFAIAENRAVFGYEWGGKEKTGLL